MDENGMIEAVDNAVADVLQKVLHYLQTERDRIVSGVQNRKNGSLKAATPPLSFTKNSELVRCIDNMVKIPFGKFTPSSSCAKPTAKDGKRSSENVDDLSEKKLPPFLLATRPNPTEKRLRVMKNDSIAVNPYVTALNGQVNNFPKPINNWLKRPEESPRDGPFPPPGDYENMQLVAKVSGPDALGKKIETPVSVAAFPERNCVAVLHSGNRISLLSSNGNIQSTFILDKITRVTPNCPAFIRPDPLNSDKLVGLILGRIFTIGPIDFSIPPKSNVLQTNERTKQLGVPFGLAISESAKSLYTAIGTSLVQISSTAWSQNDFSLRCGPSSKLLCLGVYGQKLFFRTQGGTSLGCVPFAHFGNLIVSGAKEISSGFSFIKAATFDESGNMLVADKGHGHIKVLLHEDYSQPSTAFTIPPRCGILSPADVTVMSKSGDDSFTVNDHLKTKRIVVVPDYVSHEIVYFASV